LNFKIKFLLLNKNLEQIKNINLDLTNFEIIEKDKAEKHSK
jgi:hypothetical protein